jgi:hypothetical protein
MFSIIRCGFKNLAICCMHRSWNKEWDWKGVTNYNWNLTIPPRDLINFSIRSLEVIIHFVHTNCDLAAASRIFITFLSHLLWIHPVTKLSWKQAADEFEVKSSVQETRWLSQATDLKFFRSVACDSHLVSCTLLLTSNSSAARFQENGEDTLII